MNLFNMLFYCFILMSKDEKEYQLEKLKLKFQNLINQAEEAKTKTNLKQLDSHTSLYLHKNALVNYMKEKVNKSINLDHANPSVDITEKLSELLISSKDNDKLLEKLNQLFSEKESLNRMYYNISYALESKKKSNETAIELLKEENKCIDSKITNKKNSLESLVRDHDKYITTESISIKKENYIHYPTKNNLELYMEKVHGQEIMDKLSVIMNQEKEVYIEKQGLIKLLIKKISDTKKVFNSNYNTIIEESNFSNILNSQEKDKDKNQQTQSKYMSENPSYYSHNYSSNRQSIQIDDPVDDTKYDRINLNYLGDSMDSNLFQFPKKIKIESNYNTEKPNEDKFIPKLDFNSIHSKYKNDKNVIIKEDKSNKNDNYNDILLNLINKENTKDKEISLLKNEVYDFEHKINLKKNEIHKQKKILKDNKEKNNKLNENLNEAQSKIEALIEELETVNLAVKTNTQKENFKTIDKDEEEQEQRDENNKSNKSNKSNNSIIDPDQDLYFDVFNFNENKQKTLSPMIKITDKIMKNIQLNKLKN